MILPAKPNRPHGSLDGVVVDLDPAVFEKARQPVPMGKRIADCPGEAGFLRDLHEPRVEPEFELFDEWLRLGLPGSETLACRLTADAVFDFVECANAAQGFGGGDFVATCTS
jgi:hypothetical protein